MEDKKVETEEELRARLKEELKAELLAELKEEQKKEIPTKKDSSQVNSYGNPNKRVKFGNYNDRGVKEATDLLNKDKKFETDGDGPKTYHLPQSNDESSSSMFGLVLIVIVIGIIVSSYMLLPKVYQWMASKGTPSEYVEPTPDKPQPPVVEVEEITLKSKIVRELTYPIMRSDLTTKTTYYSKDVLNIADFNNNDLLYNAFIHIYSGNLATYDGDYYGEYCGTPSTKKTFNAKYIDARIANLFTETVDYNHTTFIVPVTSTKTKYVGTWKYDKKNNRYIYYGNCQPAKKSDTVYYDLKIAYDAKGLEKNTVIEVYYYVAFAQVNKKTNTYTIYLDTEMKNKILDGDLTTDNHEQELNEILKDYITSQHKTNKYKFTFSSDNCSYENHCFVKGEWIERN